jgi:hypothetical protein
MNMILVYDIRRDTGRRKQTLSSVEDQWQAYLRGEQPVSIHEGQISGLFFAAYEGEHKFMLDEGNSQSSWDRLGDGSWYVIGHRAKVEQTIFQVSCPIGEMPFVTRIWIGEE